MTHHLNHEPKNPFCKGCQSSRVQRRRRISKKRSKKDKADKPKLAPGEEVTMDPVMDNDPRNQGLSCGEKQVKGGLFIFDKGIDLLDVQPLKSKEAVSMGHALRQHKGRRTIKNVFSDCCPSLIEELKAMRINHDLSEPGVPEPMG